MRTQVEPRIAAALLLAGTAAVHALNGALEGWPATRFDAAPQATPLPPPGSSARRTLDWCGEHVAMIHDLHWASACTAVAQEQRALQAGPVDDSPDCTLPEARAFALNRARDEAERQCLADAAAQAPAWRALSAR